MIRVQDTELLQENIIDLISFAQKHEFLNLNGDSPSPVVKDYVQVFTNGKPTPFRSRNTHQGNSGICEAPSLHPATGGGVVGRGHGPR